jgi:hypothetical protein
MYEKFLPNKKLYDNFYDTVGDQLRFELQIEIRKKYNNFFGLIVSKQKYKSFIKTINDLIDE